ncbi:hypothetical protein BS78_04G125100 [Paspalum vaginatum]|nr:hypothetical protein BS78_04G125100 [Paspalum vaginatum]
MFAFTSMGVHIIDSVNGGCGPYAFKVSGQLCHQIGSLLLGEGEHFEYAQLYIFDTDNEIRNRMAIGTYRNRKFCHNQDIVAALIDMFNTHNQIVLLFRMARDRNTEDKYAIRLFGEPDKHGDVFSFPIASKVVGSVVGDIGATDGARDLMVDDRSGQLQRVEEKHCKFMAIQYPILFPMGRMATIKKSITSGVIDLMQLSENVSQ